MNKILFLLKRREDYNVVQHSSYIGLSTGLYNSAKFMDQMLNDLGIESHLEVVIDNNCIDREVTKHKPTHVIIEALWVTPTKFEVLQKLHPNVKWIVRLHSELPFMANEGIAMDWIGDYVSYKNVYIGINAPRMLDEMKIFINSIYHDGSKDNKLIYLPNFYPQEYSKKQDTDFRNNKIIHIGCFGAVRPLKNHLTQAIAAIKFANSLGKKLHFHVNMGRVEMKGQPVAHNLHDLFTQLSSEGHELVNHEWVPREEFLKICSQMDIGMQVSFSETFNIVAADLISQGVPVVGSSEIPWLCEGFNARPTQTDEIYRALQKAYYLKGLNLIINKYNLKSYTNKTKKIWFNYFSKED